MADPPSNSMPDPVKQMALEYLTLACFCGFSLLIGLDGWRAFKKGATWFPGKAFALTGVTVQILVWESKYADSQKRQNVDTMLINHQVVVNGRVAVCVFLGYLLPGMAAPNFRVGVALAFSVCAQIGSELYLLHTQKHNTQRLAAVTWSRLVDQILFLSIIVLCLILGCTVIAGDTVRGLLKERISAVLSTQKEEELHLSSTDVGNERTMSVTWDDFEDETFKSWLAARVCQVDYVMSRSVLSSAAGILVTCSVIFAILTNRYHNIGLKETSDIVVFIFPVASFILVGWVVICWRWLASHIYFSTHRRNWKRFLYVEDFWKSSMVELIHVYDLKGVKGLTTNIIRKLKLHKLLYLVVMLQVTVIFFSNLCGLLSEIIIGKFIYWCRKRLRKGDQGPLPKRDADFLECICMLGEDPSDLWQANIGSIRRIRSTRMSEGREKGRKFVDIFHYYSLEWVDDGIQLLNKLNKKALSSVLKHFPSVEKRPWKITVVSLISMMITLQTAGDRDIVTKALKVCHEIWDLLSFIDEADIDLQAYEVSLLDDFNRDINPVSIAADKEFYRLQIEYDKQCAITYRNVNTLLEESEALLKRENLLIETPQSSEEKKPVPDLSDTKDWTKIALSYNIYKLCKVMGDDHPEDFVVWADTRFRNIISACVSKLPDMLVKQSWKWAEGFEEDKLWEAIYLASKVRGMMETWRLQPKLVFSPRMEWTLQASDHVEGSSGAQVLSDHVEESSGAQVLSG